MGCFLPWRPGGITDTSFDRVTFPRTAGTPVFVLEDATGLVVVNSTGLPDRKRSEKIADEKP